MLSSIESLLISMQLPWFAPTQPKLAKSWAPRAYEGCPLRPRTDSATERRPPAIVLRLKCLFLSTLKPQRAAREQRASREQDGKSSTARKLHLPKVQKGYESFRST